MIIVFIISRGINICFKVALVNVVHIKDSVCTLPTSILAQYLKQANGQLSCLKVSSQSRVINRASSFGANIDSFKKKKNKTVSL